MFFFCFDFFFKFIIFSLFFLLIINNQHHTSILGPLSLSLVYFIFSLSLSLSLSFLFLCLAQSYLMDPIISSLISIFCWWEFFTGGLAVFDGMIGFGLDGNIVVEFWTLVGVIGLRSFGVSWVSLWRRRSFSFWFFGQPNTEYRSLKSRWDFIWLVLLIFWLLNQE